MLCRRVIIILGVLVFATFFSATHTLASSRYILASPPKSLTSFSIYKATPGAAVIECETGGNPSKEWVIHQWNNEQSLCLDTNNAPADSQCLGANIARETNTARFCYWSAVKKVQMSTNTKNMSNQGCGDDNPKDPGGYSVYLSWDATKRLDWRSNGNYNIKNYKNLILSTNYQTNYYQASTCHDPSKEPVAFAYMNLIAGEIDPLTGNSLQTIFFQTVLYDKRGPGISDYVNCNLPSSGGNGFIVIGIPITKINGQTMNNPGQPSKLYEWDILPPLLESIKKCQGADKDISNYKITGMFVGNEQSNTTIMTNTFENPKVEVVFKDSFSPMSRDGDLNIDGVVDILDFGEWKKRYLAVPPTATLVDFGIWKNAYLTQSTN